MNPVILAAALLLDPAPVQEPGPTDRFVVCTEFTDNGNAVLRTALLKHVSFPIEIRTVKSEKLMAVISDGEVQETLAFVGYSFPRLAEVASVLPLAASPGLETGRASFLNLDRSFEGLWIDPIGIGYQLGALGGTMSAESVEGQLPERLGDLADGRFEGLLVMETPRADNATGLLLTRVAGENGGVISAVRPLERLDANVFGGYSVDLDSLLTRLIGGKVLFAVTTQRAALFYQSRDPEFRFRPVGDDACALVVGVSVAQGNPPGAEALWSALSDPVVVARLSVLEHLVPAGSSIPDSDLPVWASAARDALIESDVQLMSEAQKASGVVHYFQNEIQGVFASRRARFSEYYDAAGILLVVVFVIWMLRRAAPRESPGKRPPESR